MKPHLFALFTLFAGLSTVSPSRATEPPTCIGAWAAARPGPVMPSQKAIRLLVNPIVQTNADFSVRLLDASAQEIPVVGEYLPAGGYFLSAAQELPVGAYVLEYSDACNSAPQIIPLEVVAAPALPASIGTLSAKYDAYCPGETFDSPWGPLTKDFPPPVYVSFDLTPELHAFAPFMQGHFQDDLGTAYTSSGLLFYRDEVRIAFSRSAACSGNSLSVPLGHRILTMTAELLDGPPLPVATTEVDITCLKCPPKNQVPSGPTPPDNNNVPPPPAPAAQGCHVGQTGPSNRSAVGLVLMCLVAVQRRARRGRGVR